GHRAAPRRHDRRIPVRRGCGRPAGHGRAERVLPPLRPSREVQPAARSGGADAAGETQLAVDGRGGDRARRAHAGGGGDAMRPLLDPARNAPGDGRNIDESLGVLRGEGALQKISTLDEARPFERRPWRSDATAEEDSYYGLPLLKETVWQWPIPVYFYVGGLAGASAALGAAASVFGNGKLKRIARRGRLIAAAGAVASAGLLIQDLGVRRRFLYMLRVFRPTSPMNLGTWLLSGFGACATLALLPGRIGKAFACGSGVLGLPLTSYTGVLLNNTAVPLWSE